MRYLGYIYHNGEGVSRDYGQARQWYEKAASYGSMGAQLPLRGIRLTRDSWNTTIVTQKRPEYPPMEARGFRGLKPLWYNGVPP
jgi:TPR repeat protein